MEVIKYLILFLILIISTLISTQFIEPNKKAKVNIKETIDTQRMSVSGVDEDEEGVDLVKFKNAYNLSSKVISVMQEIYDKLIEQTGV